MAIQGVRPYVSSDRASAIEEGIPTRILDGRGAELTVATGGPKDGYATWIVLDNGSPPILGGIWVPAPVSRKHFYRLIALGVQSLVDRGYQVGWFYIRDKRVLTMVQKDFDVTVIVEGIDEDGEPDSWFVEVDLPDALEQLQAKI